MARPLRVDIEDGVYHVISRGTERCALFRGDADYLHFLDRLAEMQRRFSLSVYAYVLMNNHFHLIVCTPHANLSQAVQWLKVSYSMWFNAKYKRVGPLFQGRFKGILVDPDASWLLELSVYVHLNPVRVKRLGLGKQSKVLEDKGWKAPSKDEARERLKVLRSFRWSSYPYYAGYKRKQPDWLDCGVVQKMTPSMKAYRELVEHRITQGQPEDFLMQLKDRLVLGGEAFNEQIRARYEGGSDYEGLRALRHVRSWEDVVRAVETVRKEAWGEFASQRGNWGRAMVYCLARKYAGMSLREVGDAAGGIKYPAVSQMVKRLEKQMKEDAALEKLVDNAERILKVQT
jgi:REP element-mobilizing transposase RayT